MNDSTAKAASANYPARQVAVAANDTEGAWVAKEVLNSEVTVT